MRPLYKTTVIIWSEFNPEAVNNYELEDLARDATSGDAYCSKSDTEWIEDPAKDPEWDGNEFFGELD